MPKHTVEIPCSVGDEIIVLCGCGGQEQRTAIVQEVKYTETKFDTGVRVVVGVDTPSNRRAYLWGVSAFAKEDVV